MYLKQIITTTALAGTLIVNVARAESIRPHRDDIAQVAKADRRHLGLIVPAEPVLRASAERGSRTSDVEGSLRVTDTRTWVGIPVPAFVAVGFDDVELYQLRAVDGGYFAFYRNMFSHDGQPGCAAESMWDNCKYAGRLYTSDGSLKQQIDFNAYMKAKSHLSVSDFALGQDTLYYNESCQTYAAEAKGRCSAVVALDLKTPEPKVRWRSKPLSSNAPILIHGDYLITGYGFTDERDYIHVLSRADGRSVTKAFVKKAPEHFEIRGDQLKVLIYDSETPLSFGLGGAWGTDALAKGRPRLTPTK